MSAQVKRKNRGTQEESLQENVKKRKQDLSWLFDGLIGPDPFTVLKKFVDEVSKTNSSAAESSGADVISEFLQIGGTGSEFLTLLDTETKRKASELALIFSALEALFVRIASDLSEYRNVGIQAANSILQTYLMKIYQTLSPSSNANQVKVTLRLLTSMVTLGHLTAREVVSRFDFNQDFIANILQWRSLTDLPDVRSTYILFITSFMMEDDSVILRTLGENRAILQPIFDGIIYDAPGILEIFISALRDRVAASTFLSKTLKLRIFNAYTNQQLTNLFHWQGPRKAPRKSLKGDQPTSEPTPDLDSDIQEEQIAIGELGQSLFMALTSSHKYGIVFADYSLGLGGKNKNNAALVLLQNLTQFWEYQCERRVELQMALVVRTIQSCPDLVRWYLPPLTEYLSDIRPTKPWFALCRLIQRIIDSQNLEIIFNPREKFSCKQQAMRGASLISPLVWGQSFFATAMSHENVQVRLAAGILLQTVLKKMSQYRHILMNSRRADVYNQNEKADIFSSLKNLIRKRLLQPETLVDYCEKMFVKNAADEDDGHLVEFWSLILELMALYSQLELLTDEEKATIPAGVLLNSVMERVKQAGDDAQNLEPLQLAVIRFVSTLPGIYDMVDSQLEVFVSSLINCTVTATNIQLRQSSASFLHRVLVKSGACTLSSLEFNVWILALEQCPSASTIFKESCMILIDKRTEMSEKMDTFSGAGVANGSEGEKMAETDPNPKESYSPLLLAVLERLSQEAELGAELRTFYLSAICGLIHCQLGDARTFASRMTKETPPNLTNKSFKSYMKLWTTDGGKRTDLDCTALGLGKLSSLIFDCAFRIEDDWETFRSEWNAELTANAGRPDKLEPALHQVVRYLSLSRVRSGERQYQLVDILESILGQELEHSDESLTGKFLRHPSSVDWFDPMESADPFIIRFTSLVHVTLLKMKSSSYVLYKAKLLDAVRRAVGMPVKKGKKEAKSLRKNLLLSLIDLFDVGIQDIQPLISSIVQSKPHSATEPWLALLDCLLQKAARLRLLGIEQRIDQLIFRDVIQLFIDLGAPQEMRQGLREMIGVCPELLSGSTVCTEGLLRACLHSETDDGTEFCLLVMDACEGSRASFARWCVENESHFRQITWRLQVIPSYLSLSDDEQLLSKMHESASPAVSELLLDRVKYREYSEKFPRLEEFIRLLIGKSWSADECRDLSNKLLAQHKMGLSASQFAEVGRKFAEHQTHVKLCLRSAVWLLKSSETDNASADDVKKLVTEFDWIVRDGSAKGAMLSKALLDDALWSKFLKYALKIGLRTSSDEEEDSQLACASLSLAIKAWRLLAGNVTDDVITASQQVYEMVSSHSDFISLIMNEEGHYTEQKLLLLELLTVLIEIHPKLCQSGHIPLLLASYQATMSRTDQLILRLLHAYEKNGVALSSFKPYLWGPAAAAHYSIQRGSSMRLSMQPEANEVVALLESDKLLQTAYQFPIDLNFDSFENEAASDDYDPRFLLPLLAHILSSQYSVQCGKFTQSGVVSLVLAAMSSNCGQIRSFAWLTVGRFYDQLLTANNWPDRCLWLHMLECLRLGVTEHFPNTSGHTNPPKLSNIVTLFMAKSAAILRDPAHPMYRPINNFLVVKPVLDVTQVPEFLQLLHSTDIAIQRSQQRTFILSLIRDGVRSPRDYLVCAQRRVFRLLLSLQPSVLLVDECSKSLIIEVVQSAVRHPIIAYDMILNRGLLAWISGLVSPSMSASEAFRVLQLLETLWATLHAHLLRKRNAQEKSEVEVVAQLEKELESAEADEQSNKKSDDKVVRVKPAGKGKKPIWDLLPSHQQILPPWMVFELLHVLVRLWRGLVQVEVDSITFQMYVKTLCGVASHIHESKLFIRAAKDNHPESIVFVSPSRTLPIALLEQLVDFAPRFQKRLPDLKEHFETLKRTKVRKTEDPSALTASWHRQYCNMAQLLPLEALDDSTTRENLHMLISLAECNV